MVALVQQGHTYGVALSGGASVTLGAAPTPGNLLVAVVSIGGTVALTTTPWSATADVTSTDATIAQVFSKVAGSSESATVSIASSGGTGDLHVYEFSPSAGKTWGSSRLGPTQTANSGAATVTTQTTGTTATATADGVAVGGLAANGTAGTTATSTNAYTVHTPGASTGRGRAAYLILTSAAAQETTLGTFGTARRTTGAIATYQHETSGITGTLSASTPRATSSISGTVTAPTYTGTLVAAVALATASITGVVTAPTYTGNLSGSVPLATSSITGVVNAPTYSGTLAGTVPLAAAAVAGVVTPPTYTGTLAGTTPLATASISGTVTAPGPTTQLHLTARRLPASTATRLPGTTARRLPATLTARRLP